MGPVRLLGSILAFKALVTTSFLLLLVRHLLLLAWHLLLLASCSECCGTTNPNKYPWCEAGKDAPLLVALSASCNATDQNGHAVCAYIPQENVGMVCPDMSIVSHMWFHCHAGRKPREKCMDFALRQTCLPPV